MHERKNKPISLVTGGAGFIGSHVARNLIEMNHQVVVLDDLSGGYKRNIPSGAIFKQGSINDEKLLDRIFKKYRFDYVYHLAAYAAEGLSHFIRRFNYENNLIGSINLINRSILHNTKHFVFTSSIAVYGDHRPPMTESMIPQPEDPYGIAKYCIELDLRAASELFGLSYTIFRPHNVYGEHQNQADRYRNVLGIFINNILLGQPMTIFGDGNQTRAFSYIKDIVPPIVNSPFVKKAHNEVFNIGSDTPYTIKQLAMVVARAMGVKPNIVYLPARKEVKHAYSDHSKVKKVFRMGKTTPLTEGVKKMVIWAKKIGPVPKTTFKHIEVKKRLPRIWR